MTTFTEHYAKTDSDGNLIVPLEVCNKACAKQAGNRCKVKDEETGEFSIDPEYFAKKLFGTNYICVELEDGVSISCYSGTVTSGRADKDQDKLDAIAKVESDRVMRDTEQAWIGVIRENLNVKNVSNWKDAELKVGYNQWPTSQEFTDYDPTFIHN